MKFKQVIKQSELDNMPVVSIESLAEQSESLRNYFVYIGTDYAVGMENIHVGLASTNHLETIKELINNQPIFKVLLDTREFWERRIKK